jgi:hypothetical protein
MPLLTNCPAAVSSAPGSRTVHRLARELRAIAARDRRAAIRPGHGPLASAGARLGPSIRDFLARPPDGFEQAVLGTFAWSFGPAGSCRPATTMNGESGVS